MRRTYIIIVAALIILGTVSSFALTYVQTELDEPWGAQYTLQYVGASIGLSNPETTVIDDDTVELIFDITPNDKDVKLKVVIIPLDMNNATLTVAGSTVGTCTVTWLLTDGSQLKEPNVQLNYGEDFEATITMNLARQIDRMRIKWVDEGFTARYEGVRVLVEDVES